MRFNRKFIFIALLATVLLVGSIGGVVLAQTENDDENQPEAKCEALLNRVCAIYQENTGVAIEQEALKDAFNQAQDELRTEAMETWLQSLVENGKITQDEADQYQEWRQSKPDVQLGFGMRGPGKFQGMGGMRGRGGLCAPIK